MNPMLAHAVDGVLSRLARVYGAEFAAKFATVTPPELRSSWGQELAAFTHELDAIAWAERHLPERCPNAVQFKNLCHQAPRANVLPMARSNERVRGPTPAELEQLRALRDGIQLRRPSRQWAHDLIAKHERGERVDALPLRMAREVAGVDAVRAAGAGFPDGAASPPPPAPNPYAQFLPEEEWP